MASPPLGKAIPLTLGTSCGGERGGPSYHTHQYQFIPQSVDISKKAVVKISPPEENTSTVEVQFQNAEGGLATTLKGLAKSSTRDALLFYDGTSFRLEVVETSAYNFKPSPSTEKFKTFEKMTSGEEDAIGLGGGGFGVFSGSQADVMDLDEESSILSESTDL
eukprot:TRINITY_DN7599_c0_g1_i1.p1 TRINITY_DN7599_c0_g1~~TRINITY_DN7599_c0_g1_i1.p1  ORF type:complete len:174 (-),score=60.45 TRINITY_DN7599_c0_g1_i1:75-563(-)